ncbi:tail protein [Aeromonas salmonicida subsp. salmonicida]|uniref:Phage tail fiber assembly protein n=2 Tax=Aeromonas salmonicida subsp. salmonicida TaxID=29491 RepID=A4SL83_AERS4|nr:tail fiber assembly protein [Aeromonas salmonicida]ABO89655.1 phage tail fibre assembly protein [Aeromonas salmonicida subsp. salmonicida A449]ABO91788.1 phage tail fiber assembly protein [Aeromonas salmonicida subsp. salmonicida A449]AYO62742.1 phage tail protein [Aeromonas salmonicida subsp. salmonicida 01-B526]AYO64666.1 phage tail protein [Aeromonas salmonicida subsp. salmonicida 01-B526]EHI50110.1 phage tail fiber assembly protein [Aeromonas salmonicida subsp. salmonicida 01-B526]
MERIEVLSAAHPRHYAADPDSITLDVLFAHLPEQVQFAARKDDSEEHGRELYSRAVFGEFGDIEVITPSPPTETQQQARLNEELKQAATAMAPLKDADTLGIISDAERQRLTAWQRYRVTLYRLPQSDGWPTEVNWPEMPQ